MTSVLLLKKSIISVFACSKNGVVFFFFLLEISLNRPGTVTSGHDFLANDDFQGKNVKNYRPDCLPGFERRLEGVRAYGQWTNPLEKGRDADQQLRPQQDLEMAGSTCVPPRLSSQGPTRQSFLQLVQV